jgi:hypothetical protein
MFQNRVDPFGDIFKTSARGLWMGNRGQLHNDGQTILRPFKLKAWITCLLEFKGWKRKVMSPGLYTELFFMDEATAFSAGHRPCFECRRKDYDRFKSFWLKGNPQHGFNEKTSIREIDNIIHEERIDKNGKKVIHEENTGNLPNGIFVLFNDQPFLLMNKQLYQWSPFGYEKGIALRDIKKIEVLTPLSVVNALRAGYIPQINIT